MDRLGLNIQSSTVFPTYSTYKDIVAIVKQTTEWMDELDEWGEQLQDLYQICNDLLERAHDIVHMMDWDEEEVESDEEAESMPIFLAGHNYVIAALMPDTSDMASSEPLPTVGEPTMYEHRYRYSKDYEPEIEDMVKPDLKSGEMVEHKWANGDDYDGTSALIGIPPQMVEVLTDYVKGLGIWDIMVDTIMKNPMEPDNVRFYNVTSPFGNGERTFQWSAKRPGNFYGSDSDMHWFDAADEASHEDSLRALAKAGFDDVLKAIGNFLGLDNLVAFSIGLLAVTKSDKGYIHVDFSGSNKRAFNFLINLHSPSDEPELTIIEEDDLGNRRRGQVKYAPTFGVLNGDDAMHATNECNHRELEGLPVRITVSLFLSELEEASLEQVGEHDKYYFPFGNMDWIWAQRGRHWKRGDTSVSMVNDKGRAPFEAKDEMEGCAERVGPNKEKCLEHGDERMLCYKTCGSFISDDEFKPGEERRNLLGW